MSIPCYHSLADVQIADNFGLALGVFDGIHLGHQAVLDAARVPGGKLGVVTFDPHPIQVLFPDKAPRRILASTAHKKFILRQYAVDFLVVLPFTKEFSQQSARTFADALRHCRPKRLSCGSDWAFGAEKKGNPAKLQEWCPGVAVYPVSPVMAEGERISSTRIRQALRDGSLTSAAAMLGRPYSVFGGVVQGAQLGRTIGFPTANVASNAQLLPANGVYAVTGRLADSDNPAAPPLLGVANVGVKPTVSQDQQRSLEVHFLTGSVPQEYGWEVEIAFHRFLRPEQTFDGIESLKNQILVDADQARAFFAST